MWRFRQAVSGWVSDKLRSIISDESFRKQGGENSEYEGQNQAMAAGSAAKERINRDLPNSWWEMICDAAAERLAGRLCALIRYEWPDGGDQAALLAQARSHCWKLHDLVNAAYVDYDPADAPVH